MMTTRPDNAAWHKVEAQCSEHGLSRAACGEHICAWFTDIATQAVALCPPDALYLSGGDMAIAVAHALDAAGFQIHGRVMQCVSYGYFLGDRWS